MAGKLTIAIDFDDTFTADPKLWTEVIQKIQERGHRIICVSARRDVLEHRQALQAVLPEKVPILLSYDVPKREFALKHGYDVDIWIEDTPEAVYQGG